MRPTLEAPAMSSRRPMHSQPVQRTALDGQDVRAQAPSTMPRPSTRTAVAAVQDAFPSLDHDWDVPAFQRKHQ